MVVLVLGSKPNPSIPSIYDVIYYVNGSITYNLKNEAKVNHVFGDSIFYWEKEIAQKNITFLSDKIVDKSIVIQFRKVDNIISKLNSLNYCYTDLQFVSRKQKSQLELKYIKYRHLLSIMLMHKFSIKEKAKYIFSFAKTKEIKLSTGVYTVLLALNTYPNETIVISGIGFGSDSYSWGETSLIRRGHFINDYIAFSQLKRFGLLNNVYTTESDLINLFGISEYKGDKVDVTFSNGK